MKEYCVDFELAKELKKNYFPQNNPNFIFESGDFWNIKEWLNFQEEHGVGEELKDVKYFSAPTSDEILEELPMEYNYNDLHITKDEKEYCVGYYDYEYPVDYTSDKKLSNALAKMWLHLKNQGEIK